MCRARTILSLSLFFALPCLAWAQEDTEGFAGRKFSDWVKDLEDKDNPRKREAATFVLGKAGPRFPGIYEKLQLRLKEDPLPKIRLRAANSLGEIAVAARKDRDRLPIQSILVALSKTVGNEKEEVEVREAAVNAIRKVAELDEDFRRNDVDAQLTNTVSDLTKVLKGENPSLQSAAAEALAEFGPLGKGAIRDLIEVLKSTKGTKLLTTRLYVIQAISKVGEPESFQAVPAMIEVLREDMVATDVQRQIAEKLGQMGEGATDAAKPLAELLKLTDADKAVVRRAAAAALIRFGDKAAVVMDELKETAKNDKDTFARCHSIAALSQLTGKIKDPKEQLKMIRIFENCINDSVGDISLAGVQAMASFDPAVLGEEERKVAKDTLTVAAKSLRPQVRKAAEKALERYGKKK